MFAIYFLYDVVNICWVEEQKMAENASHFVVSVLVHEMVSEDGAVDCLPKILVDGVL